jgi:cytochrome c
MQKLVLKNYISTLFYSFENKILFIYTSESFESVIKTQVNIPFLKTLKMHQKLILFVLVLISSFSCTKPEVLDSNEKPEENRFTKVVLTQGMDEPMEMAFLPDNRIIVVERKGGVKIFDENTSAMTLVTTLNVNTKYKNKEGKVREAEEGLMGVIAHPNYNKNHWIFMYYADPDIPKHVLARWELNGDSLDESSKKIVLEIPTQREECCHTGGGMVFDKAGNLYLTVGNNTVNPQTGASNLDERLGYENNDDQRGPSNTNDLRGKILRFHPEDDGSYTIPEGNLYPKGTEKARPEIYTMGHRNPWRPTLDSETGYLYWGEVGPDANIDSIWGPKGYDEFNQAKGPGFFGWPYFVGNNRPYNSYDAESGTYGAPFDTANVVNNSVNNTGLKELPAPIPAFIYYPYGPSEEFPLVGSAGRSATGGPVYRKADFKNAPRPFPSYYEGKWLIVDFMRDWIMSVSMDENGDYLSMERFLPSQNFSAAIDMDFGPSGDLYVLEYGDAWFRKNSNSQLVKLEYNAGNRKPIVEAKADIMAAAIPFKVKLSSEGTIDYDTYDQGKLSYKWDIKSNNGVSLNFSEPNPVMDINQPGIYQVLLTVTDSKDQSNKASFEIVAGNESPKVTIDFEGANRSFYFGDPSLPYSISVSDKEDGNTDSGAIKAGEVAITFDYVPAGFDPIEVAQNQSGAELLAIDAIGKNLIEGSDCKSCHQYETKSIGPSYAEVSNKYENTIENQKLLEQRVINGSSGIWGDHAMAAHPALSEEHAQRMVQYILTFQEEKPSIVPLALEGNLHPHVPEGEDGSGVFLLRAAYQDKGAKDLKSLAGEEYITLRNPIVFPQEASSTDNTQLLTTPRTNFFVLGPSAYLGFNAIDLTTIQQIDVFVAVSPRYEAHGGLVEIRLDSPDGKLIGQSQKAIQKEEERRRFSDNDKAKTPEEIIARRRLGSQHLTVLLEPTEGVHDIYLVFKNAEAGANQVMMSVKELEFRNTKSQENPS